MVDLSACAQAVASAPRCLKHAETTIRRQQLTLFKVTGSTLSGNLLRWRLTGLPGRPVLVYAMTERSALLEEVAWRSNSLGPG